MTFDGARRRGRQHSQPVANPTVYSEELWFKTTTTRGGKLIGFGTSQIGGSAAATTGTSTCSTTASSSSAPGPGRPTSIDTERPTTTAQWHHVVATQGSDGMKLYVDGQLVGTNAQTGAQDYTGYWRVGGDTTWGGNSSNYFAGTHRRGRGLLRRRSRRRRSSDTTSGRRRLAAERAADRGLHLRRARTWSVAFDGTGSTDSDGTIASYAWDFGDGRTGTGANAEPHVRCGRHYTVTLTVTDNGGGDRADQPHRRSP